MATQKNFFTQKGQTKNSFITLMEQVSLLNKNSTEIISKFNDALSSNKSSVSVKLLNQDGTYTKYEMPTIGEFKSQIDIANTNIKRLAGLEGTTYILDGKSSKKVYSVDINREPSPIESVDSVVNFTQTNNWFFEELMNPILSVNIDLSNKVNDDINSVLSRRYIVKFKTDENGYTEDGLSSLEDFKKKFLNKTDIAIKDFETWLSNTTNIGVVSNNLEDNMDEQKFVLNLRHLNYKGTFSVLKSESDTLNNKLWYHLDTLIYYSYDGRSKFLSVDDELVINRKNSTTRYKIIEVSTANSMNRISVERVEGYDPIPIGTNVLQYYSSLINDKSVKINIGFNEYNVLFIKPINEDTNILGSAWSKGTAFYTNDLVLDTDSSKNLLDYYYKTVYDYGRLLKDLVKKIIPIDIGTKPNKPNILESNFKVVQINKHLTDTNNSEKLRDLHSQKVSVKSKLEEINNSLIDKSKELNTKNYKNIADKTKSKNEYDKLVSEQKSYTKLYSSIVSQISNSSIENRNANRKYRVRGFWNFPEPVIVKGYRPQQVIGFEYQYKYSDKIGSENSVEAIKMVPIDGNNSSEQGSTEVKTSTGYFSNWVSVKTDIRKRTFNPATEEWYWNIEDISDADTPNINQLDIPIQPNESVKIRIRSISEVGYPDSLLYSDWSEIITIKYPDDLKDILDDNEFILKEASQEEIKVQFENELASKGVVTHIQEQFYINEDYYAHSDKSISTSFKDKFGNFVNLKDYITSLTNRIELLEEKVNRIKGKLSVSFFKNTSETILSPNTETIVSVECEDYAQMSGNTRKYYNLIYVIKDYYLKFSNVAKENDLGLLSNRTYSPSSSQPSNTFYNFANLKATFVDDNDYFSTQSNYQYIWFSDNYNSYDDNIYMSGATMDEQHNILINNYNYGSDSVLNKLKNVLSDIIWSGYTGNIDNSFGAIVHPVISNNSNIIEEGQNKLKLLNANTYFTIPINIYFKFSISDDEIFEIPYNLTQTPELEKKLKILIEPDNETRPLEFKLKFKLKRNKTAFYNSTIAQTNNTVYM